MNMNAYIYEVKTCPTKERKEYGPIKSVCGGYSRHYAVVISGVVGSKSIRDARITLKAKYEDSFFYCRYIKLTKIDNGNAIPWIYQGSFYEAGD